MKIAVVELYADKLRGKRNRVALFRAIRDDKKRNSTVLTALQSIPKDHLVVFPGWTFYGSAPSEFVTEAKAHRLVVYEEIVDGFDLGRALDKGSPGFIYQWTTPVVGADVETPLVGQQIISHSGEVEQTKMKAQIGRASCRERV